MGARLFAFTCGTVTGDFARLMEGGQGDVTLPVPVFLIEHPKGRVLFDTGLHPECRNDPVGRLGIRTAKLFRIGFRPGEEVSAQLEAIDRDPARIDLVINSHFHFDHVGGNALIPNATMLVQRGEWDAATDPDIAALHGYNRRDFDLGHQLRLINGEHDVFGDGAVVCLPTPGHTAGHQSLRLRLDSGEVVLAADACYSAKRCANAVCRATCTTARQCWLRLIVLRRWNGAGPASSSAMTRNSGGRYRRRRLLSRDPLLRLGDGAIATLEY